jgi:hypothetical protein
MRRCSHDTTLTWPDGTTEHVDTILLATGYQPDVSYLDALGALDLPDAPARPPAYRPAVLALPTPVGIGSAARRPRPFAVWGMTRAMSPNG